MHIGHMVILHTHFPAQARAAKWLVYIDFNEQRTSEGKKKNQTYQPEKYENIYLPFAALPPLSN